MNGSKTMKPSVPFFLLLRIFDILKHSNAPYAHKDIIFKIF